jgi:prepilin-type N-terminal cleavage/methylation domain-containing protein
MRQGALEGRPILNEKGVTLIELLVVLVISGIVVGGIYKVFIAQTRAYTAQDQVAEVQQDVRGAMEIMVRDIRMAGYQTNNFPAQYPNGSLLISGQQIVTPLNSNSIQVYYEYQYNPNSNPTGPQVYAVTYSWTGTTLNRRLQIFDANANPVSDNTSDLLDNVASLNFMYGVELNEDGIINGINTATGIIPDNPNAPNYPFLTYTAVNGNATAKILAVQIQLTANPASTDPDVNKIVSPRTLTSVVTPRNIFFKRYTAY